MLTLLLFGPVRVQRAGHDAALPTQKVQALLALLALGGRTNRAQVAALLWPGLDAPSARRNLRRELARLRDLGLGDLIDTDGDGLSLAGGLDCDVADFDHQLQQHQPERALARHPGRPLAEGMALPGAVEFNEWLDQQRQRAPAAGRPAPDAAASTCEARGDVQAALDWLAQLLDDDPLHERHYRDRMRLLAAGGRRDAALAEYQRCRDVLGRELGLSPDAETRALLATLRVAHAAGAGSTAAAPATPPEGGPSTWPAQWPLVGREAPWAQLRSAWQQQALVVIEGEAGVGKTRLASDFAAVQGPFALAQCRRSDAGVPYASFTRVLRQLAGQDLLHSGLPAWVRAELSQLLPELGDAQQGPVPALLSQQDQHRFHQACAAAWRQLSHDSFDAVLIDDWHLADAASAALLGYLIGQRSAGEARVLLILRPELAVAERTRLNLLMAAGPSCHVQLQPLAFESVYELVQQLSRAPEPRRFAARLVQATGGNPFFVLETLRHWLSTRLVQQGADGVWETPFDDATNSYAELPVPDSVRSTILQRVQGQSDAVRRLLEAAALASEPFGPTLLAGACALSELETLDAIEAAIDAQLLRERDGGFAFAHDLLQAAVEGSLTPVRRRLMHRRLALGATAAGLPAADIARHWEAGGEPARAVAPRISAAETALALYADADAERHWLAALADGPTLAQRVRILGQRWRALVHRGDEPALAEVVAALDDVARQARAGDPALALEADLHAAEILAQAQRNDDAQARIGRCLADPALPAPLRAQALRVHSQVLSRLGHTDEARQATEDALAADGLSTLQRGDLLHALSYTHFLRGEPRQSLVYARRALDAWETAGARRQVAQAVASIGRALDMLDQRDAAWAELERAYDMASALGLLDLQRVVANNLANNRLHHGGPARAIRVIREAWALSEHFTMRAMPVFYLGILSEAHAQLGDLGAAFDLAEQALARARELDEALTLADCATMTLDLYTLTGDIEGGTRLVNSLRGRSLDGLSYFRVKLDLHLALRQLQLGDRSGARRRLHALGDPRQLQQPADQAGARLRLADLALADGDPEAALQCLAPLVDTELYTDLRAGCLRARLQAGLALGRVDAGLLAQADAALTSGQLPVLHAMDLARWRADAARNGGDEGTAERLWQGLLAEVQRLGATLEGRPRQQALWHERWAGLGLTRRVA